MKEKVIFRNGEKVYLRPVCKEDVSKLHVHINDEEVTRYLLVRHPMSLEMEEEWFDGIKKKMETDITLAVVEHKSDELVGVISLHKINHLNGTATFGITLRKYFWRKGYATEASILLFNYAFKDLNLRKINSSVFEGNEVSIKLHDKLGFQEEGILEKQQYRNGRYINEILFALFRSNFFSS